MAKDHPHRPYELQEYDPAWKQRFLETSKRLSAIFGNNLIEIDHIGSTSIVGMVAKPQIDILAVVENLDEVTKQYQAFRSAGFEPKGRGFVAIDDEYIIEDAPDGNRLTSIHTLEQNNPKIAEYKIFRDYLQSNDEDRNLYIATKKNLYSLYKDNYPQYNSGKSETINAIKDRAKHWHKTLRNNLT